MLLILQVEAPTREACLHQALHLFFDLLDMPDAQSIGGEDPNIETKFAADFSQGKIDEIYDHPTKE